MSPTNADSGFRKGGASAYAAALAQEHRRRLRELKKRLKAAESIDEAAACRAEIRDLKSDYKRRLKDIGRSLF